MALIAILIMLLPACGNSYDTFYRYGISFRYPAGFELSEYDVIGDSANKTSGAVQVRAPSGEPVRAFQVNWMETIVYGLENSLQNAFNGMEKGSGIDNVEKRKLVEDEKDGIRMLCQYYTLTTDDTSKASGIVASFYYPDERMLFTVVTLTPAGEEAEILSDFRSYLDSFSYEAPCE
jgi:hypothetical protein